MPEIANAAYFPAGTLLIGTDGYKAAIESAVLTPTTATAVIRDIGGGITQIADLPVWALAIGLVQDLKTATSLTQYLIANAGQKKQIVYTPQATGKAFTVTALIIAGAVGGAGGQVAKASVTLPVDGQPTIA